MTKQVIAVSEIFLVNSKKQILLQLRDDKAGIAGRNKWNILGGRKNNDENFKECIKRETMEEIGIELKQPKIIDKIEDYKNGLKYVHYIYYGFIDFKAEELNLKEGRKIKFFYPDKIESHDFNKVDWFNKVYAKPLNKLKKILTNNKNMDIKKATIKDLKEIESLNNKFFHEKRNFKEIIENKNNNFFVAKEKKIIVGFSGIHHFRWNNTAQIIDIFVHPDYRGKGYANQFIKKIKIISKELKVRTIIAEAPSLNNVLAVYLKNGFRICGFNDRYYSNDAKEIALFLSYDIN